MRRKVYTKEILELIESRGLKQKWLASELDYTPEYFNDIIYYRRGYKLNPYKAPVLAKHLKVDLATILKLFGLPRKYLKVLGDGGLEPPTSCL